LAEAKAPIFRAKGPGMKRSIGAISTTRWLGRVMAAASLLVLVLGAAPAEARKYPKIFGSIELFSPKTQRFPKWLDMLDRFQGGTKLCESSTCTTKGWKEFIAELQGKDLMTQLKEVNSAFNAHRYTLDINNWGIEDYWETPYQFLKKNGDCEDYAISKYFTLKALGVPVEDMRVVALQDLNLHLGHAVLVVYVGDDPPLMLDNQISSVVQANSIKHYNPVFSINETGWWLHRR
jgi:predicted transglutaminase-like cysteine proteinase